MRQDTDKYRPRDPKAKKKPTPVVDINTVVVKKKKMQQPIIAFSELTPNCIYINQDGQYLRFLRYGRIYGTGDRCAVFQMASDLLCVVEAKHFYN